jgi:hypothetical protein
LFMLQKLFRYFFLSHSISAPYIILFLFIYFCILVISSIPFHYILTLVSLFWRWSRQSSAQIFQKSGRHLKSLVGARNTT